MAPKRSVDELLNGQQARHQLSRLERIEWIHGSAIPAPDRHKADSDGRSSCVKVPAQLHWREVIVAKAVEARNATRFWTRAKAWDELFLDELRVLGLILSTVPCALHERQQNRRDDVPP